MTQTDAFLKGEGDAWLQRNKNKLNAKDDLVLYALTQLVGIPRNGAYLEIGCSNGWRLNEIKKVYNAKQISGIEPSVKAASEARRNGIDIARGDASALPWDSESFDIVIYGFCLYLCDRKDLFKIVAEGDRVLKDKGLIIIQDFSDFHYPCKRPYEHKNGIWSYKQNYSELFLANPAYSHVLSIAIPTKTASGVDILRKDLERGWPPCV